MTPDLRRAESPTLVLDMHSDIPYAVAISRVNGRPGSLVDYHLPQLRSGGLRGGIWALGGDYWQPAALPAQDVKGAVLAVHDTLVTAVSQGPAATDFVAVTTVSEMRRAVARGRIAFFLAIEGAAALEDDVANLQLFFERGVRFLGLVHNRANSVAGSSGDTTGLSSFGRAVVMEAASMGMVVDIAHLSERAALEVVDLVPGAVLCSHSNAKELCAHERNLSNDLIDALAEAGGVVGVNFFPHYVDLKSPSLARLIDHIDYLSRRIGAERVGIGADFVDYREDAQFPDYPTGLRHAGEFSGLAPALLDRGFLPFEVKGILGENLARMAGGVLDREDP